MLSDSQRTVHQHDMIPALVNRRTFIQAVGGAMAAGALPVGRLYGGAESSTPDSATAGTITVPFFSRPDVLICGSTLFACQLALETAKKGLKTVLAVERVNPFFEGISCLRSWLEAADSRLFPSVVRGVLQEATSEEKDGRLYFNAFKAALEIEDQLIESGVRILYNTTVAGALGSGGELCGVLFGGKTGLFAIESPRIIDATPEATVARAAGARTDPLPQAIRRYHYVVDLASPVPCRHVQYTSKTGLNVSVEVHHYYASFDVDLSSTSTGPFALQEDFLRVYEASLEMPWKDAEKRFRGADGFLCSGLDRVDCSGGRIKDHPNLLVFGPHSITGNTAGSLALTDWKALFAAFPNAVETLLRINPRPAPSNKRYEFWNRGIPASKDSETKQSHQFHDPGFLEPETDLRSIDFHPPTTALKSSTVIVGGGTSGNAAAYSCASLGLETLCLERGFELGGTNTLGGVTNLWFGNRTQAFEDYYAAMGAKNDGLNAPGFFRGITKAGAKLLFGSVITGVAQRDRCIDRVYVATPFGLSAVGAGTIVDATGDGSLAAWAGCAYTFGGEHDELTLWASFAGYKPGKPEALRPFLSPCDERSPLDATRFILSMRRNGKLAPDQKHIPPPFYLAPRESRHIQGERTLTFLDLLSGRRFRDGVFRVESNPDIKGLATSDAAKSGLIPTNWRALYRVTVPFGAMLPQSLENVVIAGKAYSATHDALSAARMQRDLCVMGMVAAHAVHIAHKSGKLLRHLPIEELQAILISKGMLKPTDIAEDDLGFGLAPADMARKVASKTNFDDALIPTAMLCVIPRETALEALRPHLASLNPNLQRVCSFLGIKESLTATLMEVEKAFSEQTLSSELFGGLATKHLMPDQGYAPMTALQLGCLAYHCDPRAVPLLITLARKSNFTQEDLRSAWGYLYSLACGFERLACKEGVQPLKAVLESPLFQNRLVRRTGDLRTCKDTVSERLAYLRMALSRALLRCGELEGALNLCAFLDEARVCLARAARAELTSAFDLDLGFDAEAWHRWILANKSSIRCNPMTRSFA